MTTAKKDNNATAKVKKGEELLAVLKELLADGAKILESVSALDERLDSLEEKLNRALPPNPGRFTRI